MIINAAHRLIASQRPLDPALKADILDRIKNLGREIARQADSWFWPHDRRHQAKHYQTWDRAMRILYTYAKRADTHEAMLEIINHTLKTINTGVERNRLLRMREALK